MTGGGFDSELHPVAPSCSYGEEIPCRLKANRKNFLGKSDGNSFTVASYEILVDGPPFVAGRVRIGDTGGVIGEFSVLWTEYLDAVHVYKIVV